MNVKKGNAFTRPPGQMDIVRVRRPLWMPASNYYALTLAITTAFFFLVWGILHDGGDETPWISAAIASAVVLVGAVLLREIFMRRARNRYLRVQRNFDRELRNVYSRMGNNDREHEKLSIEQNAAILKEIAKKSDAARTLDKYAAVHREVFEMCGEYIGRNDRELQTIGAGSPRLAPLRKSRDKVAEYHRYHLLKWASIESRDLTHEARSRVAMEGKIEAAHAAIAVIDEALAYYPAERDLLDSRQVVLEMVASLEVTSIVEKAERATFDGDYKTARALYRDALFHLGRDHIGSSNRDAAAARINSEIERLLELESAY